MLAADFPVSHFNGEHYKSSAVTVHVLYMSSRCKWSLVKSLARLPCLYRRVTASEFSGRSQILAGGGRFASCDYSTCIIRGLLNIRGKKKCYLWEKKTVYFLLLISTYSWCTFLINTISPLWVWKWTERGGRDVTGEGKWQLALRLVVFTLLCSNLTLSSYRSIINDAYFILVIINKVYGYKPVPLAATPDTCCNKTDAPDVSWTQPVAFPPQWHFFR